MPGAGSCSSRSVSCAVPPRPPPPLYLQNPLWQICHHVLTKFVYSCLVRFTRTNLTWCIDSRVPSHLCSAATFLWSVRSGISKPARLYSSSSRLFTNSSSLTRLGRGLPGRFSLCSCASSLSRRARNLRPVRVLRHSLLLDQLVHLLAPQAPLLWIQRHLEPSDSVH